MKYLANKYLPWQISLGFSYLVLSMIRIFYDHLVPFLHIGGSNWVWVFRCVPDILGQKSMFLTIYGEDDWLEVVTNERVVPRSNLMKILPSPTSRIHLCSSSKAFSSSYLFTDSPHAAWQIFHNFVKVKKIAVAKGKRSTDFLN